jgi:WD40 repeat protein
MSLSKKVAGGPNAKVFVSYSRKDSAFAERLVRALKKANVEAYLDKRDIAPGEAWRERLGALILAADTVVFILSPNALQSEVCKWEVEEAERLGKRILPVVLRGSGEGAPRQLSRLNFIFFFKQGFFGRRDRFDTALRELVSAVQTDIGWIREHTRIGELAAAWERSGRKADHTLRGDALQPAEAWLKLRSPSAPMPTNLQAEFLQESRVNYDREEEERKKSIDRILIGQSRLLAGLASEAIGRGDPVTGVLLALEGLPFAETQRPYTPEPEASIYSGLQSLRERLVLTHRASVNRVSLSADGQRALTASDDESVAIWDVQTGEQLRRFNCGAGVSRAIFSPDGTQVAAACSDKIVRLWDVATASIIGILEGHKERVTSVSFSPDGSLFLSASVWDDAACVWETLGWRKVGALNGHHGGILDAQFSPDGARIVTASADKTARIWDAASCKETSILQGHKARVWSATFSGSGAQIVTTSDDGTAKIWDSTKELISLGSQVRGHQGMVATATFSPDGELVVTAGIDGTTRIWYAANGEELAVLRHGDAVNYVRFNSNGSRVITASSDATARIWRVSDGAEVFCLRGHLDGVWCAIISQNGQAALTASGDGTARIWTIEERPLGQPDWQVELDEQVKSLTLCEDGVHVLVQTRGWTGALNVNDRKMYEVTADMRPKSASEKVKEKELLLNGVRIAANCSNFNADKTRVVVGCGDDNSDRPADNAVRLYDVATGKRLAEFLGADQEINHVLFGPREGTVIASSVDRVVRAWRVFPSTEQAVQWCRETLPRALSVSQREQAYLDPAPPDWCLGRWPFIQ